MGGSKGEGVAQIQRNQYQKCSLVAISRIHAAHAPVLTYIHTVRGGRGRVCVFVCLLLQSVACSVNVADTNTVTERQEERAGARQGGAVSGGGPRSKGVSGAG